MLPEHAMPNSIGGAPPTGLVDVLMRGRAAHYRALDLPVGSYAEQAVRAEALCAASEKTAAAWRAILRWTVSPGVADDRPHWVYVSAVRTAQRREEGNVRFWRETAEFWRYRAAGLDPCEVDAERWAHELPGRWAS